MMLDTADNKIYFPRFYDIDTICSYDNSGQLKFDVDIEMEQGYWNTSSSRLWTRIRDLMHNDIVTTYNDMRQNGVSYENMMHYIYDEQIAKIPQTYYNKDYDIKYAPFADSYIGMAHGDTYEHVKRWLKQRFTFVDTLFDYAPSYNNDVLTIRANTTELMTLEIETYTPVYQHLSWYNGQMDKKKIDGKVSVEFSGTAQAATDQEVLIYGGSNVKSIKGITSMNPNRMLIGSATKLVEIDAHDCPLLADINANKANLSPHEYLNKVNLSNCPLLEGNLRLNNSPLVQEINIKGTNITGMNLPSSIRNLQILRLPNTMTDLTLNDASMLHTLEFDEGVNLQSISMTNCNALENVINFDLLQTPSITLNNSYNTVAELYFRDTTNLSLSNMANLERVIYTPNNEYETFELINVVNAPDYKVTTFNCPKLSTFMTTAPYRESYNNVSGYVDKESITLYNLGLPKDIVFKNNYYITNSTGLLTEGSMDYSSSEFFIEVTPGVTYKLEFESHVANGQIIFYKTNNANDYVKVEDVSHISISSKSIEFTVPFEYKYIRIQAPCLDVSADNTIFGSLLKTTIQAKDYGDIQPNITFTANSIDISSTQFTDVKLLCTTDANILKLPTTVKNFYCDSSFDLDTDYLEDGEYDVVHGELVEPYTTDYEGEVLYQRDIEQYYPITDTNTFTDVIPIIDGADVIVTPIDGSIEYICYVRHYSNYDNAVSDNPAQEQEFRGAESGKPIIITSTRPYIRLHLATRYASYKVTYKAEPATPNLIPSSADGSLIFSMYAPSNTVAPASGTWDLKGLEFDNFHTFGMNNDVKIIYPDAEELMINYYKNSQGQYYTCMIPTNATSANSGQINFKFYDKEGNDITYDRTCYYTLYDENMNYLDSDNTGGTSYVDLYVSSSNTKIAKYIQLSQRSTSIDTIYKAIVTDSGYPRKQTTYYTGVVASSSNELPYEKDKSSYPITMPARYDDYNITIKNAKISPKTHNTMLYPLLVNEDNPITGTLDYTNYAGKHLSWSFAYTDEDYANITQPKDELLNSYEYRYYAFYQTDYEFDNPYEIARYTSSASGVLPGFNTEFTYTYDEIDNGDGTYTTKIYADSLDNLPTLINFVAKPIISVDKLNTSQATNLQSLFQSCSKLERVDARYWDTSKVITMRQAFFGTNSLTSLDLSNWDTSNVNDMANMFNGCSSLTPLDISKFDTSSVITMQGMFQNCIGLTSLDVSGFDTSKVTNMNDMFNGCNKLTSLDLSGFNTSNVTSMGSMFRGCNNLTSIDLSGFDTSNVTTMDSMFNDCNSLSSIDLSGFDTSNVTNMYQMFFNCTNLTSLDVSSFNTSKVTNMSGMFNSCNSLTSLDVSNFDTSNVINMSSIFQNCDNLTSLDLRGFNTSNVTSMASMFYDCSKLTSLNVSGFNTSKVTNMVYMFVNCSQLISLNVENWSSDNVNIIISQLSASPSTSTLYGTVIIDETTLPRGWVYDNALVIAKYTANATGVLPGFNTEFIYTYDEIDNDDGTYTTKVYTDSLDNLPTRISFSGKTTLLTVDKLNTSRVTNMEQMFRECTGLTSLDLSKLDTSNVTDMSSMFYDCSGLTSLNLRGFNTKNVIYMYYMFYNCRGLTSLDLSGFDTSEVTEMWDMFAECSGLTSLNLSGFDTKNVISMSGMFVGCNNLTSLDLSEFNTSKVVDMSVMFYYCTGLTSLDLSGFDMSYVTDMGDMFTGCSKLIELDSMQNIPEALDLSTTVLDTTSLLDVINNLATVTTTQTLTLGSTLLAKLTEEQIAIAVNKGWTVV